MSGHPTCQRAQLVDLRPDGGSAQQRQLAAQRAHHTVGVRQSHMGPARRHLIGERGRLVEPAPYRRQHGLPCQHHHRTGRVPGEFGRACVGRQRGLGAVYVGQFHPGHVNPEQPAQLQGDITGPARMPDDLLGDAEPLTGRGRIPQGVQAAVQHLCEHASRAGRLARRSRPGLGDRLVSEFPPAGRCRGIGKQFPGESRQHPGPDRRRQHFPGRLLKQPDQPDLRLQEPGPRLAVQREREHSEPVRADHFIGQRASVPGQARRQQPQPVHCVRRQFRQDFGHLGLGQRPKP